MAKAMHHVPARLKARRTGTRTGASMILFQWIEPIGEGPNPDDPVVRECDGPEAIRRMRHAFTFARPGQVDPRDDERCLDEFEMLHWATRTAVDMGIVAGNSWTVTSPWLMKLRFI